MGKFNKDKLWGGRKVWCWISAVRLYIPRSHNRTEQNYGILTSPILMDLHHSPGSSLFYKTWDKGAAYGLLWGGRVTRDGERNVSQEVGGEKEECSASFFFRDVAPTKDSQASPRELFSPEAQLEVPGDRVRHKGERGNCLPSYGTVCLPSVGSTVLTKP